MTIVTNLRYNNKNKENESNDEVHPEQPAKEGKVGSNHGAEVRLDLFDTKLPRDQQIGSVGCLTLHLLPILEGTESNKC